MAIVQHVTTVIENGAPTGASTLEREGLGFFFFYHICWAHKLGTHYTMRTTMQWRQGFDDIPSSVYPRRNDVLVLFQLNIMISLTNS